MKSTLRFALIGTAFALASCMGSSDDSDSKDDKNKYEFKDQALTGKINKTDWNFVSGYARLSAVDSSYSYSFTLTDTTGDDPCSIWMDGTYEKVIFAIKSASEKLETKVYPIQMKLFKLEESQTVTLVYRVDGGTPNNSIATRGAIEILEVTDTTIKGRLDAYANDFSSVNGNFEVNLCQ